MGTPWSQGPAYLASSVANIYTPSASTIFTVIRHIHVVNVTSGPVSFTLYIGATGGSAGGTELFKSHNVNAFSEYDYYCYRKMLSTEFLSGLASAATSLVIDVAGEKFVVLA